MNYTNKRPNCPDGECHFYKSGISDGCYECGRHAGIKEVTEWIENNLAGGTENYIGIDGRKWQVKLKDWGIE